jgi:NhaP-type Na+/H+ or K+/H+ antiporter
VFVTLLRAESLVSDGTALVVYAVAVAATVDAAPPAGCTSTGFAALLLSVGALMIGSAPGGRSGPGWRCACTSSGTTRLPS